MRTDGNANTMTARATSEQANAPTRDEVRLLNESSRRDDSSIAAEPAADKSRRMRALRN